MSPRLKRILKLVGYPLFYLTLLIGFSYLTFPVERLQQTVEAEFNARQDPTDPITLTIGELDTYWFSGVQAEGVTLVGAIKPAGPDGKVPPRDRFLIDEVTARASMLELLFGVVEVNFDATAFGGTLTGMTSDADKIRKIQVELVDVDVRRMPFLRGAVGAPMGGSMSGTVELELPEGKYSEANGSIKLTISNLSLGDGKTKIRDAIALPKLNAGTLTLEAKIVEGRLTIEKFGCKGPDFEVVGDGKVRLRDPIESSLAEMGLRFKFTDKYRKKSDITEALLGKPGSKVGGALDLDPKVKKAKRADGFYAWRLTGPLKALKFNPNKGGTRKSTRSRGSSRFLKKRKTTPKKKKK